MIAVPESLKAVARRTGLRRSAVAQVRARYERRFLASMPRRPQVESGRILCYHSVGTPEWGINDVSPAGFRRQIDVALRLGYRFVKPSVIASGQGSAKDLAITFDDGLASVLEHGAPILAENDIPWTMFVVAGWTDGDHPFGEGLILDWKGVGSLASAGVEIGSHSMTHPDFGSLDYAMALSELAQSRRTIAKHTGTPPTAFAIPLGQSKNWTQAASAAAREAGYDLVYAQSVRTRPEGTVPRTFITGVDDLRTYRAAIEGAFDSWEEWV